MNILELMTWCEENNVQLHMYTCTPGTTRIRLQDLKTGKRVAHIFTHLEVEHCRFDVISYELNNLIKELNEQQDSSGGSVEEDR